MSQPNYQPPSSPPPSHGPGQGQGASTLAIMSLVAGIAGWVFIPLLGSIAAMVMAKMELSNIQDGKSSPAGQGLATAGYWLGAIQVGLWVLSCIGTAIMTIVVLVAYFAFGVALFGISALQ